MKLTNIVSNNDQLAQTRYSIQQDATKTFTNNKAKAENNFLNNFTDLNRNETDDLLMKAFVYRENNNGKYGYNHHIPLDTRVVQFFGLKTGTNPQPFTWNKQPKAFTLMGE
jgi:hypothetical protein